MRETSDTGRKRTTHVRINQGQLCSFIVVLVVHVVDQVEGVHVETGQPIHHLVKAFHHFVVVEVFGSDRAQFGAHLHECLFVNAAINSVEHALCQIGTSTEKLHFLTGFRSRYAAADGVIITPDRAHHIIVFILNRRRVDGNLRGVVTESFRQVLRVQNRQIRFRRRSHIFKGMQEAEVILGDHGAAVHTKACHFQSSPHRVAREQLVIGRNTSKFHHTEFEHQVVNQFLGFGFRERAFSQITLNVDIQERGNTADRHGSAILSFNSG